MCTHVNEGTERKPTHFSWSALKGTAILGPHILWSMSLSCVRYVCGLSVVSSLAV